MIFNTNTGLKKIVNPLQSGQEIVSLSKKNLSLKKSCWDVTFLLGVSFIQVRQ